VKQESTQFDQLKDILLPILAEASVGRFDLEVPIDPSGDREFNELLAGFQMLLDVITQLQTQVKAEKKKANDSQRNTANILSNILDTTMK
jgi:predicted thioredoxin/glutaredoxin